MPKTDLKTLIGKRDNAIQSVQELFEEFEAVLAVEPNLDRLETIFNLVEAKYRNIKKQQETITDRIVEDNLSGSDELLKSNCEVGKELTNNYLQLARTFAAY
jgi:predicted phage gp36 major capsid-like protein